MKLFARKLTVLAAALALTMCLTGCGVKVTGVTLDLPDTLERGESMTAAPEYTFDGASPESAELEKKIGALGMAYSSSDPDVVSVDENGNITALGIGTAEVSLRSADGKISASRAVEVVVTPTGLAMADSLTLTESDNKATLDAAVTPSDATHVKLNFESSDTDVVEVDELGNVEAKSVGESMVTASIEGTDLKKECRITVLPDVKEVNLSDTSLKILQGATASLTYTVAPENALDPGAAYESSDESIATVDEEGTITAVANGKATITVTVAGVSSSCEVTVYTQAANTNNSASAGSGASASQSAAASSGFETGAIPFSMANDDHWWSIDQSDYVYAAVLNNINSMRAAGGLAALTPSSSLDAIADSRCDYQLVNDTLSHDGAQTPEILAQSQKSAAEVCQAWQTSPSHYAVIMNPNFTQIGICCYFEIGGGAIWCCTFG